MNIVRPELPKPSLVCSGCGKIGFFETFRLPGIDKVFFHHNRTWLPLAETESKVVLSGGEETGLCPTCLEKRTKGSRYIARENRVQMDLFGK